MFTDRLCLKHNRKRSDQQNTEVYIKVSVCCECFGHIYYNISMFISETASENNCGILAFVALKSKVVGHTSEIIHTSMTSLHRRHCLAYFSFITKLLRHFRLINNYPKYIK